MTSEIINIIIGFFGSFARNEEKAGSDIDILYRINDIALKKYSGYKFIGLYEKIKRRLEIRDRSC